MLNQKPKVLHLSCHGIKNCEDTMGANYALNKAKGFLLFEQPCGGGELVSSNQLEDFINSCGIKFDLVFVAACKSQFVGQIF